MDSRSACEGRLFVDLSLGNGLDAGDAVFRGEGLAAPEVRSIDRPERPHLFKRVLSRNGASCDWG